MAAQGIEVAQLIATMSLDTGSLNSDMAGARSALQRVAAGLKDVDAATSSTKGNITSYASAVRELTAADFGHVQASQALQANFRGIGRAAGQARSGFAGLGYEARKWGYIADDIQYIGQNGMGLRPIINNLFQLNPALGFAALAADQAFRHWDQFKEAIGDVGPFKGVLRQIEDVASSLGLIPAKADEAAEAAKRLQSAMQAVASVKGADQQAVGGAVKETLEALGGGEAVRAKAVSNLMKQSGGIDRKQAEESVSKVIADALGGDQGARQRLESLHPGFKAEYGQHTDEFKKSVQEQGRADAQAEADQRKHNREREQARQKEADRYAAAIEKESATAFGQGAIDEPAIRDRLKKAGITGVEELADMTGRVYDKVLKDYDSQARETAVGRGISFEAAKGEMARDVAGKAAEEKQREQERIAREEETAARKAAAHAAELDPGVEKKAQDDILRARVAGLSAEEAKAREVAALEESLKAKGLGAEEAGAAAGAIAGEASRKVQESVVGEALKAPAASQTVHGGEAFQEMLQGATAATDQRKKMVELLAQIAKNTGEADRKPMDLTFK